MHQMLDLWVGLGALACRTSVLVVDNITIENQSIVCLERLIRDRPAKLSSLANPKAEVRELVRLWQRLDQPRLDQPRTEESAFVHPEEARATPLPSGISPSTPLRPMFVEMDRTPNLTVDRLRRILDKYAYNAIPVSRQVPTATDAPWADAPPIAAAATIEEDPEITADLPSAAAPPQVTYAAMTDVGLQRSHNEDTFAIWERRDRRIDPDHDREVIRGLYVLCDGMGGHASGEIASQLATQTLIDFFQSQWLGSIPDPATIRDGIMAANRAVYEINDQDHAHGLGRMGTTLAALWLDNTDAMIAHVGDSRVYRYTRSAGLEQLTIDHDVGQESIRSGLSPSRAYRLPNAYRLTQAIGPHDETEVAPDIQSFTIAEDTLFLLASDGLTDNNLLDRHDLPPLAPLLDPQTNLDDATTSLIDFANRENGHDNTTIVLVRVILD